MLNEGMECIRDLVRDTAAVTHSLSCGTNDRDSNEVRYMRLWTCWKGFRAETPRRLRAGIRRAFSFLMGPEKATLGEWEVWSTKDQDEVKSGAGSGAGEEELLSVEC